MKLPRLLIATPLREGASSNYVKELVPLNPLYNEELKHYLRRFSPEDPSPLTDFAAPALTSASAHKDKVTGHPRKVKLGPWMMPVFRALANMRGLRGSWLDLFGYSKERRMERRMIATDISRLCALSMEPSCSPSPN